MALFGYFVYMVITALVTVLSFAVWMWPSSNHNSEKILLFVSVCLFWYGAYNWWPFNPITLAS